MNMNLYRIFLRHRNDPQLQKRNQLIDQLSDKKSFSDSDLNEIRAYRSMPPREQSHRIPTATEATKDAFATDDTKEQMRLLMRLSEVGAVIASAILTFHNPYKYATIEIRAWNQLVRKFDFPYPEKESGAEFSAPEYEEYMKKIIGLSDEHGMKPADVEYTLDLISREKIE